MCDAHTRGLCTAYNRITTEDGSICGSQQATNVAKELQDELNRRQRAPTSTAGANEHQRALTSTNERQRAPEGTPLYPVCHTRPTGSVQWGGRSVATNGSVRWEMLQPPYQTRDTFHGIEVRDKEACSERILSCACLYIGMWFVVDTGWVTDICTCMSTIKITELSQKYERKQKRLIRT